MLQSFENSAAAIAEQVTSGKLDPLDVAKFYADRTDQLVKDLNTHSFWDREQFLEHCKKQAVYIKAELQKGRKPRLAGVPILIKDNICTKGFPTTASSKILKGFVSIYDATVIERLLKEGAFIFGKASMDEFAMGSSNEYSVHGPVKNPWDKTRVPGGSSGGSAAAVAADMVPVALGSDTGGSVRQPASFCGVVGLKPTYGRISRFGLIAFGSSLDQIGPLTRTVKDTALLLDVMSGRDPHDSTSLAAGPTNVYETLKNTNVAAGLKGLKVGVVKELTGEGLQSDVSQAFQDAVAKFKELGAEVTEISLPNIKYCIATYYIVATAEASSNLSRYDGIRYGQRSTTQGQALKDLYVSTRSEGFGREVKQRIMLGTYVLSSGYYEAYYAKATKARELIRKDFERAFGKVDLLLSPTAPTTAFGIGQKTSNSMEMYLSDICTLASNLARVPSVSIPCGFDGKGLPIGLQILAGEMKEELMLKGAYVYEQSTDWNKRRPKC